MQVTVPTTKDRRKASQGVDPFGRSTNARIHKYAIEFPDRKRFGCGYFGTTLQAG
jgi:hypothetical protein